MLPISLRPNGRRAVIVGGGSVAARKAESLVSAGFPIFVVSERIGEPLRALVRASGGSCAERCYAAGDLDGAALAVAATDDASVNARVVDDARALHVLVCDASDPERGDFTMPATRRLGDLTIGVDSGGASPAFARRVADELIGGLDPAYADAVSGLAQMRAYVKEAFPRGERETILRALAERPAAELSALPAAQLVCATRESALAGIQSRSIAALLARRGVVTTMLGVTTSGDRDRTRPLDRFGEVNVFVKELESALRERRADYAVHSCKDLAGTLPEDMRIVAISTRADARDAFCSERYETFESLPAGATVGTSSPRRRAQLASWRSDLRYENLRGNVDTRLKKLMDGQYDAIVLAMAGLERLRLAAKYVVPLSVELIVPAVGQGALAVETLAVNEALAALLREAANDPHSELCIVCERAALRALRAGCSAPLGVHARLDDTAMRVDAFYAPEPHDVRRVTLERSIRNLEEAAALGGLVAAELTGSPAIATGGLR
jgi:hydroxymethylbilane synthase